MEMMGIVKVNAMESEGYSYHVCSLPAAMIEIRPEILRFPGIRNGFS